ncbi:hypothetical protein PFLUOLIPICF7_01735 [Pseudomonas simiae]|uniref:hypothetical protein n=1 Tax=Pseudomonas simiae TaxID=321846 RepID=UPI0005D85EE7|nr:hypothetical protein [Pseudomonas simiae]AJZ96909.1 hypothetical protein PFLUOLIPICF7_01735 [Pseudomonas simiae]
MTCILVAHLGSEVVVAADKRAVQYKADGTLTVACDDVQKIVRTGVGVITGAGMVEMLDPVKSALKGVNFGDPFDVLDLIQAARRRYSEVHSDSSRLDEDLRKTSWVFTFVDVDSKGQAVTRVAYYLQSHNADSLRELGSGFVICMPGGFTCEQADEVRNQLQEVVTSSLNTNPYEQAKQEIIKHMLYLMNEVAETSISVSRVCDIAVVNGAIADIWLNVSSDDA